MQSLLTAKRKDMKLTAKQIERQDFVDNEIQALLNSVNPTNNKLQWDIEVIAEIRDVISAYFSSKGICQEEDFYPEVK